MFLLLERAGAHVDFSSHRKYADTIPRPFGVRYNAYTQSIEVLDSKPQLDNLLHNINLEMHILQNALKKL